MYYKYNNITIYYEKYGTKGKDILILPGWGNTSKTFYNIINHLKENNTVYIIDYPSFGKSPIPKKNLTIYNYADLIRNFLIQKNITSPIIIAHSFGGRITTLLAGYYKIKIDKLILIDNIDTLIDRVKNESNGNIYTMVCFDMTEIIRKKILEDNNGKN